MKRITHTQRTLQKKYYTNTSHSHLIIQPHPSPTHLGPAGQLQLHRYMGSWTLHNQLTHCQAGRKNGKYTYSRQKQILSEDRKIAPPMTNSHLWWPSVKDNNAAPLPPFKQKEKHKRLKAAAQRTNPAWSSCYDGFQLSAAATGKWTQKWRKKRHRHNIIYANEQPVCSPLAGFCKNSTRSTDSMAGEEKDGVETAIVWCLPSLDDFRDNAKIVFVPFIRRAFVRRGRLFPVLFTLAFSALQWRSKGTAKQHNRKSNKNAAKIHSTSSTEMEWKKGGCWKKKRAKNGFSKRPASIRVISVALSLFVRQLPAVKSSQTVEKKKSQRREEKGKHGCLCTPSSRSCAWSEKGEKLSVKKGRGNPCYILIRKCAYEDIFTIIGKRGK